MSVLSITVDLDRLIPVSCTSAFAAMLGYPSQALCLENFAQINHFSGYNLLQLAGPSVPGDSCNIRVFNRQLTVVGHVDQILLDPVKSEMTVTARAARHNESRLKLPGYDAEQCLSLLDRCLNEDGIDGSYYVEQETAPFDCSICGERTEAGQAGFRVIMPGYKPSIAERQGLIDREVSLALVDQKSSWKLLFRYAHQTGFHISIGARSEGELELAFSLSGDSHG